MRRWYVPLLQDSIDAAQSATPSTSNNVQLTFMEAHQQRLNMLRFFGSGDDEGFVLESSPGKPFSSCIVTVGGAKRVKSRVRQ